MTIQHDACALQAGQHSGQVMRIAFRGNGGFANTPRCLVIRTLPVLFLRTDVSKSVVGPKFRC